jgi:hypothetical protein
VLVLDMHYLNATPNALTTDVKVDVFTVKEADVTTSAGIIFFYNPIIRVPAMSAAQARMACPVHGDFQIFNLQSHMHRRGIGYTANITDGTPTTVLSQMYSSMSWENVPVQNYSPPLTVSSGQWLDYRCQYQNSEDRVIDQGLTTKDEMCMLIGAYAPANPAFQYCSALGDKGPASAANFYGNGSTSCMSTISCIEALGLTGMPRGSTQLDALYQCVLGGCENAGPAMSDMIRCEFSAMSQSCSTQCKGGMTASACTTCLHSTCSTEMSACAAVTCA